MRKLTVDDIVDLRAYERERDEFRATIIALKKARRVALGELMTIVFENTDTMRFQIQEMARAERMLRDEQIEHEVETYNELIPERRRAVGHVVHRDHRPRTALREWLPKLAGIQRHVSIDVAGTERARRRDRRGAAHPRRRDHVDRALLEVRVHARSSRRRSPPGPVTHRGRPSRRTRRRPSSTDDQRAALAGRLRRD